MVFLGFWIVLNVEDRLLFGWFLFDSIFSVMVVECFGCDIFELIDLKKLLCIIVLGGFVFILFGWMKFLILVSMIFNMFEVLIVLIEVLMSFF